MSEEKGKSAYMHICVKQIGAMNFLGRQVWGVAYIDVQNRHGVIVICNRNQLQSITVFK